jgi:hypothetical protein
MSLLELFCNIDDFCQTFVPKWEQEMLQNGKKRRRRPGQLYLSEIITLLVHFHQMRFRDFKTYYLSYVLPHLRSEFPGLVSYNRFVELTPSALGPLCAYLQNCYGDCTGISFIDSTPIVVCHNRRIGQHRVFEGVAQRGKNSVGWFYGFKLHLVVNDRGELLACRLTAGNKDDRAPVSKLAKRLFGWLYGDKGYISQTLVKELLEKLGLHFITKIRDNMKNHLISLSDHVLLRKRAILESVIDQLKNISQIEHTRHRSLTSLMVNLVCGLIAYCHQPKKPSLHLVPYPHLEDVIPN